MVNVIMSYRGHKQSPYQNSPGYGYSNVQKSSSVNASPQQSTSFLGGWGTPARNFSPSQKMQSPIGRGSDYSQRHCQFRNNSPNSSPRHLSFNNTPGFNQQQNRYPSPGERQFKTPQSPFSPPNSLGSGKQNGSGRKSYNRNFYQNPRQDRNCNPGGSGNIEDYYHPSMLEDPWKFCPPVPVNHGPSLTT